MRCAIRLASGSILLYLTTSSYDTKTAQFGPWGGPPCPPVLVGTMADPRPKWQRFIFDLTGCPRPAARGDPDPGENLKPCLLSTFEFKRRSSSHFRIPTSAFFFYSFVEFFSVFIKSSGVGAAGLGWAGGGGAGGVEAAAGGVPPACGGDDGLVAAAGVAEDGFDAAAGNPADQFKGKSCSSNKSPFRVNMNTVAV
jgi:hypothetical protein